MDDSLLRQAVPPLLRWYAINRREMPWREEPDAYRVWISEIMLQQTRIEAVLPYYARFLRELPTVYDLAEISDDRLMKLWEGLGYYSRARNLKRAAQIIVSRYGGRLPRKAEELRALPGIGDYTAGAIASIAYGENSPAVDGNVLRVVMRLTACEDDIAAIGTKKSVAEALHGIYPSGNDAASLTQAWMELGETVCLPNGAPACEACPLRTLCRAYQAGNVRDYPVKSRKKERKIQPKTVFLLWNDGCLAIRKRGQSGLLAGTWEFPTVDGTAEGQELTAQLRCMGVNPLSVEECGRSTHIFTHIEWHMRWISVRCANRADGLLWRTAEEIAADYAVPSAFRYYKKCLCSKGGQQRVPDEKENKI